MLSDSAKCICDKLTSAGISFELREHEAVFTIDEMLALSLPHADRVAKNLFLRDDKKRHYYLLVVAQDQTVNLRTLQNKIGSRRLSFASEEDLGSFLGLAKGSVSPLGVLNDTQCAVEVFFDRSYELPRDHTRGFLSPQTQF